MNSFTKLKLYRLPRKSWSQLNVKYQPMIRPDIVDGIMVKEKSKTLSENTASSTGLNQIRLCVSQSTNPVLTRTQKIKVQVPLVYSNI